MDMDMKCKFLHEAAVLPDKAHPSDLGWDLYSCETVVIPSQSRHVVKTGIAIQFPPLVGGILKDRSGVAGKLGLFVHAGVIDPNYRGEIMVLMYNSNISPIEISAGTKIAQMVLMPAFQLSGSLEEVDELDVTDRGENGFGSSGG